MPDLVGGFEIIAPDNPGHPIFERSHYVRVDLEIRDNSNGKVRRGPWGEYYYHTPAYEGGGLGISFFNWEENNYSCDCNRSLFFHRIGGDDEPESVSCGDGRFDVRIWNPRLGEVIYEDGDWNA